MDIYFNLPAFVSFNDYKKGKSFSDAEYTDKLKLLFGPFEQTVIVGYSDHHISRIKIIPAGTWSVFTYDKIVNIVNEVLAKNSKLKALYKDAHGYLKPEAEECTQYLIRHHLQALPDLLNNRKKMTEVLMMEKLL